MPVTHSREHTERGIRIREDRYESGLVEIAYYGPASGAAALALIDKQPGTRKWHVYGATGPRPFTSLRTKTGALVVALEHACQELAKATP